jgi:hypothetical protein
MRRSLAVLGIATMLAVSPVHAQLVPTDPDWKELEAPPPPALKLEGLVPLDVPGTTLRFGVDPASVSLSEDRVVRYVVVATSSSGAINAMYEGIRCSTAEFKVYARYFPGSGWSVARNSQWLSLHDPQPSSHSLTMARTAACKGNGADGSAAQIVRNLRSPIDTRFR